MLTYPAFSGCRISLAAFGLEKRLQVRYFCTPIGAKTTYHTGVDGIHYCLINGFDETVFCVDPTAEPGSFVLPVAKNFADFLGLLCACGQEAAISQARWMTEERFRAFLAENPPDESQLSLIHRLHEKYEIPTIEDPYSYIHTLQSSFDPSALRFSREYRELFPAEKPKPAWKVTYNGGFFGNRGRGGKCVPVNAVFPWEEETVHIPAVYLCPEGIVVDLCIEFDPEKCKAFSEKWGNEEDLSYNDSHRAYFENPMTLYFRGELSAGNTILRQMHGYGLTYVPFPNYEQPGALDVLEHYGLDSSRAWCIDRYCYPCTDAKVKKAEEFILRLQTEASPAYAETFTAQVGKSVTLTNPMTGKCHTLTPTSITPVALPEETLPVNRMFCPRFFLRMEFTLQPDLPYSFLLEDTVPSDEPLYITPEDTAVGIIGRADGPTAIAFGLPHGHLAHSSFHFEVPESVTWQAVFLEKRRQDLTLSFSIKKS